MILYAILDKKAGFYGPVMQGAADGPMCRQLQEIFAQSPGNNIARYPEDFDLYELGSYDDLTGSVERTSPVRLVVNMSIVLNNGGFRHADA